MSDKMIYIYEGFSKTLPYAIGLGVNLISFQDALIRIITTCISMLVGAVAVHYLKPFIISKIDKLRKK